MTPISSPEEMPDRESGPTGVQQAYQKLGDALFAAAQFERAAEAYGEGIKQARRESPKSVPAALHRDRAAASVRCGDFSTAFRDYVLAADQGDSFDAEALDEATRLLENGVSDDELEWAEIVTEGWRPDRAEQAATNAIRRFIRALTVVRRQTANAIADRAAQLCERFSEVLRAQGDLDSAARLLRDGLQDLQDGARDARARLSVALGGVLIDMEDVPGATAVLDDAPDVDGAMGDALTVLQARCALREDEAGSALERLDPLLQAEDDDDVQIDARLMRARALLQRGEMGDAKLAADEAERVLGLAPTHAEALLVRGEAVLAAGEDHDLARQLLELYLRRVQTSADTADQPFTAEAAHARRLLTRNEIEAARKAYPDVADDLETSEPSLEFARRRLLDGNGSGATRLLDLIPEPKRDGFWRLLRATAHATVEEGDLAIAEYEQATEEARRDTDIVTVYAEAMYANSRAASGAARRRFVSSAASAWDEVAAAVPERADVHLALGRALRSVGDPDAALVAADRALELLAAEGRDDDDNDVRADAWQLKAELLHAINGDPGAQADAFYEAGRRRSRQGAARRKDALTLLKQAQELQPDDPRVYWQLARLELRASETTARPYADADHVKQGIDWWDQGNAIAAPSGDALWAYVTRADLEHQQARLTPDGATGCWWRAVDFLEQMLAQHADPPAHAVAILAASHRRLDNKLVAAETLAIVPEKSGEPADVLRERINVLIDTGSFDAARELLRTRADDAGAAHSQFLAARLAQRQGRHEEAAELLTQLLRESPEDVETRGRLAASLIRLGRDDEAAAHYRAIWSQQKVLINDERREWGADAGYRLFVLKREPIAALNQSMRMFAGLSNGLESRAHEGLNQVMALGLCRLAAGSVNEGVADIEKVIQAARFDHQLARIKDEIAFLRRMLTEPAAHERLEAASDELEAQLSARRRLPTPRPPASVHDELARSLDSETRQSDWRSKGAAASLARLEAGAGHRRA